jgi:uncharacterized protein
VIRDRVWDHLHGFTRPTAVRDLDLAFFDPVALGGERERGVERALCARAPDIAWDVTNQAAVHLWYRQTFGSDVAPLASSAEGVATWPEAATAVGIRLLDDDGIKVVAPFGLEDLFGMICRRNPRRVTLEQYRRRVATKRIAQRWPRVRILDI